MDGFLSFKNLSDNIPVWHERLDRLSQQVTDRHTEFIRLSRQSLTSHGSLRKKRTGSTESLRPADESPQSPDRTTRKNSGDPVRIEINPESKRLFQDYRQQSKRKRLTPSVTSNGSGPPLLRPKSSAIVYYDSAIQEDFSWLVRTIAGARNTLRKAKTTASMRARMSSMGMEESPFRGDHVDFSMRNPKIPRLTKLPALDGSSSGGAYSPIPFEEIDKELEAAQSLCEIGAHQFLRDGNCNEELAGTKERFYAVLKIAEEQRDAYEAEAKMEESQRGKSSTIPNTPALDKNSTFDMSTQRRILVDSDIAVDADITSPASIAVENINPLSGSIAVDSSIAVDNSIAVDPTHAAKPTTFNASVGEPGNIAIDNSMAVDSAHVNMSTIAIDSAYTSHNDIAIDPQALFNQRKPYDSIAVDKTAAIDTIAVDSAYSSGFPMVDRSIAVDPTPNAAAFAYGGHPIDVDVNDDEASFHVDLSAFRRTTRA